MPTPLPTVKLPSIQTQYLGTTAAQEELAEAQGGARSC